MSGDQDRVTDVDRLAAALVMAIEAERGALRWSIKDLATRSGIPTRSLERYLSPTEPREMRQKDIARVAAALGLRVSELWRLAEERAARSGTGHSGERPPESKSAATSRAPAVHDS